MDRLYRLNREPPSVLDRLLARPLETVIAAWSIIAGGQLLVTASSTGVVYSQSAALLPSILALVMAGAVGLGGLISIIGLLPPWKYSGHAWFIERIGSTLCAAGWIGYSVIVLAAYPDSGLSWGGALAIGLALLARVAGLVACESHARSIQRQVVTERQVGGDS